MRRKVNKDCPFSREEIATFHAMLYAVNTGNHCMNPAPFIWAEGYQRHEEYERINKEDKT